MSQHFLKFGAKVVDKNTTSEFQYANSELLPSIKFKQKNCLYVRNFIIKFFFAMTFEIIANSLKWRCHKAWGPLKFLAAFIAKSMILIEATFMLSVKGAQACEYWPFIFVGFASVSETTDYLLCF